MSWNTAKIEMFFAMGAKYQVGSICLVMKIVNHCRSVRSPYTTVEKVLTKFMLMVRFCLMLLLFHSHSVIILVNIRAKVCRGEGDMS
jgi:hypothetical protein